MHVAVTGAGAVTSVGRNVAAACAAIQAGITRPRKVTGFTVVDAETQDDIPLTGYPIQGYTEGFSLLGRWMRLARGCVRDLLSQPHIPGASNRRFWEMTGLTVAVAYPDEDVLLADEGSAMSLIQDEFLGPLHEVLGLPVPRRNVEFVAVGHTGTALSLQQAERKLSERRLERVLVVAVDSYLDPLVLTQLAEMGRLKTPEHPVGLMPGEAGVCILAEAEVIARRRNAPILGKLVGLATGSEPNHLHSSTRNMGQGLAACLRQVLDHISPSAPFQGDVFIDLNGESWRAHEWGSTQVRLAERLGPIQLHLPASAVGDVGAASGALSLCLALHSQGPHQEPRGPMLVLSSSDRGDVGCIAIQPSP